MKDTTQLHLKNKQNMCETLCMFIGLSSSIDLTEKLTMDLNPGLLLPMRDGCENDLIYDKVIEV